MSTCETTKQGSLVSDKRDVTVLTRLSDVEAKSPEWLWPNRIQRGALNIVAGDPGLGKSLVTMDMAARVSRGTPWPDTPKERNPQGNVILLAAEDNLDDAVKPRLEAAGADAERIIALQAVKRSDGDTRAPLLKHDIAVLETAVEEVGDVRLVVIDPINSYLGDIDSNRNEDVRSVLEPLKQLAERKNVAIVMVQHLNKTLQQMKAIYRVSGSMAFAALARSVLAVTRDKKNRQWRLFTSVKVNNAKDPIGLAFAIRDEGGVPVVAWDSKPIDMSADEALAAEQGEPHQPKAMDIAMDWARERLADGPVKSEDLFGEAKEAGVSEATLRKALKRIGAKRGRDKGVKTSPWHWSLPEQDPEKGRKNDPPNNIEGKHDKDDQHDQHVEETRVITPANKCCTCLHAEFSEIPVPIWL